MFERPAQGTGPPRRATAPASTSARSSTSATSCTTGPGSPNVTPPSAGSSMPTHAEVHPVTRAIINGAGDDSARPTCSGPSTGDASWRGRRRPSGRTSTRSCVPSVPTIPTLAAVEADPIGVNARLGMFSTFVNLLDLCAVAVPGGSSLSDRRRGARRFHPGRAGLLRLVPPRPGRPVPTDGRPPTRAQRGARIGIVRGADRGRPPHPRPCRWPWSGPISPASHSTTNCVERGARLAARTTTAPAYRLVALADTTPAKPGLVRVDDRRGGDRGRGVGHADRPSSARSSTASRPRSPSASSNSPTARG